MAKHDRPLLWYLTIAYLLFAFVNATLNPHGLWDFDVYWWAGRTWLDGGNPYANPAGGSLPFLYPPLFLVLIAPLALLPHGVAALLFMTLKAGALAILLVTWKRLVDAFPAADFRLSLVPVLFPIFAVLAFSSALLSDVLAGNVAIFEQCALWLGVLMVVRGRYRLAGALIVVASLVKLAPGLLLPVLLVAGQAQGSGRRAEARRAFLLGSLALAGVVVAQALLAPGLFSGFLEAARTARDWNETNPSSLVLMAHLVEWLAQRLTPGLSVSTEVALTYGLWGLLVLLFLLSYRNAARHLGRRGAEGTLPLILLTVALYASIVPRMNPYSFIIMVVPAFFALTRNAAASALVAIILFMAPVRGELPSWGPGPWDLVQDFYPLLLTWIVFVLLCREARANPPDSMGVQQLPEK